MAEEAERAIDVLRYLKESEHTECSNNFAESRLVLFVQANVQGRGSQASRFESFRYGTLTGEEVGHHVVPLDIANLSMCEQRWRVVVHVIDIHIILLKKNIKCRIWK